MGVALVQRQTTDEGLNRMLRLNGRARRILRVLRADDGVHADNGYLVSPQEVDGAVRTETKGVNLRTYATTSPDTSWRPPYFPDLAGFPISLGSLLLIEGDAFFPDITKTPR